MNKYDLWYSESECCYTMFPAEHDPATHGVEEDAVLLKTFEVPTWEDARCKQHEFLGWEPYKPLEE